MAVTPKSLRPYLAIPLTSSCNFRCPYCDCNGHGEAIGSSKSVMALGYFKEVVQCAYDLGIRRFRITGGEPFLEKELGQFVRYICSWSDVSLTVDTNGSILRDSEYILSQPPPNFRVVLSLDTLRQERSMSMTGRRLDIAQIHDNARTLASRRILKRINMVITPVNFDEVDSMIQFCRSIGTNLKLTDVARRISQGRPHAEIYHDVQELFEQLCRSAGSVEEHPYSSEYGSPMKVCVFENIRVTLKSRSSGARFAMNEACNNCLHFPCDEGMYFISALADGTFTPCQMNGIQLSGDVRSTLVHMLRIVEGATHVALSWNKRIPIVEV